MRWLGACSLVSLAAGCGAPAPPPSATPPATSATVAGSVVPDETPGPVPPQSTGGIADVVTGWGWTCIANADGTVDCRGATVGSVGCGGGSTAAIFDGARPRRIAEIDGARDLVAGQMNVCAITVGRRVRCWGANDAGQLGPSAPAEGGESAVEIAGLEDVSSLAVGGHHVCVLTGGGPMCWGGNESGQLGRGTTSPGESAPAAPLDLPADVVELAAGGRHTCARTSGGALLCWGDSSGGQLGPPAGDSVAAPRPLDLEPVEQVVAGGMTTCARTGDGRALCWGARWVGDPERGIPYDPLPEAQDVALERPAARLVAGGDLMCALDADGRAACWTSGEAEGFSRWPSDLGESATILAPSETHVCMLRTTGEVACRGDNGSGQLGLVGYHDGTRPVEAVGLEDAVRVVVGEGFSAALRSDGRVARWGRFATGEGGDWTSLTPAEVAGIDDGAAISAGRWHVCVLRRSGTVACWGDNQVGQLGDGTNKGKLEPVAMIGVADAVELATAATQTCARLRDGRVTCSSNPADDGTEVQRDLDTTGVKQVIGGWAGIYTLHDDGHVLLWGLNRYETVSQPMTSFDNALSLELGVCTTCARWADGSAGCLYPSWESWICQPAWEVLEGVRALGPVAHVAPGARHVCVRLQDASVVCAGEGDVGQLGRGSYDNSNAFVPVEGLADATDLACGESHCCAVRASGRVACWGSNYRGELGDGKQGGVPLPRVGSFTVVPAS